MKNHYIKYEWEEQMFRKYRKLQRNEQTYSNHEINATVSRAIPLSFFLFYREKKRKKQTI